MKKERRNLMVGIFALTGAIFLGWLIFRFQQFPKFLQQYDRLKVTILFDTASGIQESTSIYFCGYPVGHVIEVHPPQLTTANENDTKAVIVKVTAALTKDIPIPANVTPKIYLRGLGSSYIDLTLNEPISETLLAQGQELNGQLSEASEFISEKTQSQLDQLIASLTELSQTMQMQLKPLPPSQVDKTGEHPNVTTLVIRMDQTLKNLNNSLGDPDNQRNLKEGLANIASLTRRADQFFVKADELAVEAAALMDKVSASLDNIDTMSQGAATEIHVLSQKIQTTAQQITDSFVVIQQVVDQLNTGNGSGAKLLNDPRLYEALTDAFENLDLTIADLRILIDDARQKGVRLSLW